eukprot:3296078-Lingulodinium_polyedra.AAC.1
MDVEFGIVMMMSGPQAVAGATARILQNMPSTKRSMTPETSVQLMSQLQGHSSWKVAPSRSQALLVWAKTIVTDLCEEKPLSVGDAK